MHFSIYVNKRNFGTKTYQGYSNVSSKFHRDLNGVFGFWVFTRRVDEVG